ELPHRRLVTAEAVADVPHAGAELVRAFQRLGPAAVELPAELGETERVGPVGPQRVGLGRDLIQAAGEVFELLHHRLELGGLEVHLLEQPDPAPALVLEIAPRAAALAGGPPGAGSPGE